MYYQYYIYDIHVLLNDIGSWKHWYTSEWWQ